MVLCVRAGRACPVDTSQPGHSNPSPRRATEANGQLRGRLRGRGRGILSCEADHLVLDTRVIAVQISPIVALLAIVS